MKQCGKAASGAKNSLKINVIRAIGYFVISIVICAISGLSAIGTRGLICALLSGAFTALSLIGVLLVIASAVLTNL